MFHCGVKSPVVSPMSRCNSSLDKIAAGKPEEAAASLLREMSLDPGYRGGLYVLSLAYKAMGHGQLAAETARLYLELEPEGYWASNARAKLVEWNADANKQK
jgi:hypothetical protein